ncbi:MAG: DUF3800 domain-containing protein [Chloroflexota bacterium]
MIDPVFHYAFIDESGTVGVPNGAHFLVVAVLTSTQPRDLELPVRRALKKYGRSLTQGEIKATHASEKMNLRMLEAIAGRDVSIVAVIVNQQAITRPPDDLEQIYRQAVARAIHILAERFPQVEICLDKRYTHEPLRYELERHIREDLVDISRQFVLIRQESSQARKELQAADAVAWAFFQKYERGDARFYDVVASKVIAEELIERRNWK